MTHAKYLPAGLLLVALMLAVLQSTTATFAQSDAKPDDKKEVDQAYIREHYTKYEYRIAMRDGVKLFTAVYAPKDASTAYPILLSRTPYNCKPYGVDQYPTMPRGQLANYAKEKFIFVYQDVRGRFGSEGVFSHIRPHNPNKSASDIDESTDSYDTIDWLVKHVPNNNGKVGMMGISYPGFYTSAGMIDSHPALKCASPQAPVSDWFMGDDFHHNGAFYLPHAFHWLSFFGQTLEEPTREQYKPFDYKTPDGYEFYLKIGPLANVEKMHFKGKITFWKELMEHGTNDEFWTSRNIGPHLKNIKAAVLTVGGWFDAEDLYGTLRTYQDVERQNPSITNTLVMGPWAHGQWSAGSGDQLGHVNFAEKTGPFYREHIELPFLKQYLKDDKDAKLPEAFVFETGTNQWRRYDSWPPKAVTEKTFYFHPGGRLSLRAAGGSVARVRRICERPGQAGAVRAEYRGGHVARAHARRPAVCLHAARRAGVSNRRAGGGHHDRRADCAAAERIDHGHRQRLGREADRRLLG